MNKFLDLSFKPRAFLAFSLGFILFTVIGTVSHEYGHILFAKAYGHDTQLHHDRMHYYPAGYLEDENYLALRNLNKRLEGIPKAEWSAEDQASFAEYNQTLSKDYAEAWPKGKLWIRAGGPLQTILTGLFGLGLLYYRQSSQKQYGFKTLDWLAIFLALFWLREVFNLFTSIASECLSPNGTWFGGDEYILARDLNLWPGSIATLAGLAGLAISLVVIFKFIPRHLRLSFLASGFFGGLLGFYLWMKLLGPVILP